VGGASEEDTLPGLLLTEQRGAASAWSTRSTPPAAD
jgi:hypothetical protein